MPEKVSSIQKNTWVNYYEGQLKYYKQLFYPMLFLCAIPAIIGMSEKESIAWGLSGSLICGSINYLMYKFASKSTRLALQAWENAETE